MSGGILARFRWWWVIPPALLAALFWSAETGPTLCPFARCTGLACPGCGMTRAVAALLRGDLSRSWDRHPLAGIVALEVMAAWWWLRKRQSLPGLVVKAGVALNAAAFLAVWVWRFVNGALPPL